VPDDSVQILIFAAGAENSGAADGEAENGSQCGDEHDIGAEMQDVDDDGGEGEDETEYVEPERGANPAAALRAKTKLQEKSRESDGRDNNQGEWTGEGRAARVDHHESQGEEQQSGGNDAPAPGLGSGARVGSGVGQGVPSQVIQGGVRVFQIKRNRLSFRQFPLSQIFCRCQCICRLDLYIRLHSRSFPVGL
jgi:hypothetical protein